MTRVDRLLRWVWLINGLVLLALLVAGGGFLLVELLSSLGGGPPSEAAPSARGAGHAAALGPPRYDPPLPVRGTDERVVLVRHGTGYAYTSVASSAPRTGEGAIVNVAFLDAGGGVRLLLERPAYIRRVAFPGHEDGELASADSARRLRRFVYEMALRDTDGDGAVGEEDRRSLYVSGLDGRGLRQVLPDGYELRDWSPQPDGSLVVTALRLGGDARQMPERAFVVDPSGSVRPYAQLDSAMDAAGTIIGGK